MARPKTLMMQYMVLFSQRTVQLPATGIDRQNYLTLQYKMHTKDATRKTTYIHAHIPVPTCTHRSRNPNRESRVYDDIRDNPTVVVDRGKAHHYNCYRRHHQCKDTCVVK